MHLHPVASGLVSTFQVLRRILSADLEPRLIQATPMIHWVLVPSTITPQQASSAIHSFFNPSSLISSPSRSLVPPAASMADEQQTFENLPVGTSSGAIEFIKFDLAAALAHIESLYTNEGKIPFHHILKIICRDLCSHGNNEIDVNGPAPLGRLQIIIANSVWQRVCKWPCGILAPSPKSLFSN